MAVVVLLSLLLGWWVDTPRRTAHRFHALIADGRFVDADGMLVRPSKLIIAENLVDFHYRDDRTWVSGGSPPHLQHQFASTPVTLLPSTFSDIVRRRRFFRVAGDKALNYTRFEVNGSQIQMIHELSEDIIKLENPFGD